MRDPYPRGARLILTLEATVSQDDGGDQVFVNLLHSHLHVPRLCIADVKPPIQHEGAEVWHTADEQLLTVVLHDETAGQYLLRDANGMLRLRKDDGQILPKADYLALTAKEDPDAWKTRRRPGKRPPGFERDPIGTELGAEDIGVQPRDPLPAPGQEEADVAPAPALEHGPNCAHTFMDVACNADGCLGEIPF